MANTVNVFCCNVRGLRDYKKRTDFVSRFIYLSELQKTPQICMLQETHSTVENARIMKKTFASYHCIMAHDSHREGGILTAIHKSLNPKIKSVIRDRSFLIVRCEIEGEDYLLVNVHFRYFSNHCRTTAEEFNKSLQEMWAHVTKFKVFKQIFAGDFNEILEDNESTGITKHKHGKKYFQNFVKETGLSDVWRAFNPTSIRFTHFAERNKMQKGITMKRIDRFLVSDLMFNYCYNASIGTAYLSDHAPIYLSFFLNRNEPGKGLFRFPLCLCTDERFRRLLAKDIRIFIETNIDNVLPEERPNPDVVWDTLKAIIRGRTIKYLAHMNKLRKDKIKQLDKEVYEATLVRDSNTDDLEELNLSQIEVDRRQKLLEEEVNRLSKKRSACNIDKAKTYQNVSSAYFFRKVKGIPGSLRYMIDKNDRELVTDHEILNHCQVFYQNLYGFNVPSFKLSNFMDIPLDCKLSEEDRKFLAEPIEEEELVQALGKMKKDASPGLDGFTVPFYQSFWDLIGSFVVQSIKWAENCKSFSKDQRRGVIKLLPKKHKSPARIENLRPITLLCVEFKILTKALALRIKNILTSIIHVDQSGFIINRFLGSNVVDAQTLLHMMEELEDFKDTTLISLDIHKAFDSCRLAFLKRSLGRLWFSGIFYGLG